MATLDAKGGPLPSLAGKKGLIVGIANEHSIAYGCAQAIGELGGTLALTYLNAKAEHYVRPLAEALRAEIIAPLDVERPDEMDALFTQIAARWGRLDFLLHAIAYAPAADLHGRVIDSSAAGFARAMDISCHSFLRLARAAEPLMKEGGALITMSYYGAQKVIPHYGIMGPVKAALEACVRALAAELGPGRGPRKTKSPTSKMATRAGLHTAPPDASAERRRAQPDRGRPPKPDYQVPKPSVESG